MHFLRMDWDHWNKLVLEVASDIFLDILCNSKTWSELEAQELIHVLGTNL